MTQPALDKIIITDLLARGRIGVPDEERERPQDILINLILFTDLHTAGKSDRIEDSVDYSVVSKRVLQAVEANKRHTVEALAADLAELCLALPGVQTVQVRVEKPNRVRFTRAVGVEITRSL